MHLWFIPFTLINYLSCLIIPLECHLINPYRQKSNLTEGQKYEEAVLHFNNLVYANHLHNPCSSGDSEEHRRALLEDDINLTDLSDTPGNKIGLALLRELITKSTFLQGLTTNIIRMNLIEECTTLRLPYVANVPSLAQLKSQSMVDSLRALYTSLTNQTAHVFFIWDQQKRFLSHNCSNHWSQTAANSHQYDPNGETQSKLLAQHYWTIAVNLRDLMCLSSQALSTFNIDLKTQEATDKVLSHSVTDTSLCSRKAVRDCQIMKSSIVLLDNMSDYLRDQIVTLSSTLINK